MLRKFIMAAAAIQLSTFLFAQDVAVTSPPASGSAVSDNTGADKKPFLTITGSADAYYRFDFAKTKANNFTAFTNSHNAFQLGMASVKLEHHSDKVGFVADLGFGQRAKEFSYNDDGITQAIKQLYISYNATSWLKFTAGTWATHVGYELVDPQLNRNYSMSYMFTNGPFSHTGVKAEVSKGKHGVMLGISNATDYRTPPDGQINKKFVIAQYSYAVNDNWKLYLNYVGGKAPDSSKTNQVDAVITGKFSDKFSIGYNGTVNSIQSWDGTKNVDGKSWWGSALYLNVDPKAWLGFTLRGEYFSDKDQLKTFAAFPEGGNIFATTLSANFKVDGFIFIPEVRFESASKNIYVDKNGNPTGTAGNFLLAAVYSF